ncbi:MAG TPA: terminase, partial [Bacillota bacterium]|nr:terminase [Bacillota bacterium]
QAANLARTMHALESVPVGSNEHAKPSRLAMALSRAVAVHPTATAGRAVDQVNANTAEREARAGMGDDDLIPRLRAV